MKICTISLPRPDISPHGIERCTWCYSRELAKLGCEIHILYNYNTYPHGPLENRIENVYLHGIPTTSGSNPILRRLLFYRKCQQAIKKLNSKYNFDLFSLYGPLAIPFIPFLKRYNTPVVLHTPTASLYEMQTYLSDIILTLPNSLPMLIRYFETTLYELTLLRLADAIIVPTYRNIKEFNLYWTLNGRFYAVPLGQDIYDRFYRKILDKINKYRMKFGNKRILLFIGTNWHRKGLKFLLYAFRRVINIIPSVLIIVGPPQEPYVLLMKRLGLKIGEDVFIMGYVSDEELSLFYASCDVFLLPSSHEAFSQTVIEVIAFGKPVIVSPIASYPIIKHGIEGFVVNPTEINSFAGALIKLLSNDKLYRIMSKRAFNKAQLYTWKNCAKKLYKNYIKILLAYRKKSFKA